MIDVHTLEPGGQTALHMAGRVAAFLGDAHRSLDLALYDVRLPDEPGDIVAAALRDADARGVTVRIAYNADHDERVFPPPPRTKPELLDRLPLQAIGIPGIPDLMHHKYVVRDGESVWTGSANWTTDSWTIQENVVVVAGSVDVAGELPAILRRSGVCGTSTAPGTPSRGDCRSGAATHARGSRRATAKSCRTGSPPRWRRVAGAYESRRR
jgi:hypothetical protein